MLSAGKRMTLTSKRGRSLEIRLIVFDLDGVLIDSLTVMQAALQYAFSRAGYPGKAPFDRFRQYLGMGLTDIFREIELPPTLAHDFVAESDRRIEDIRLCVGTVQLLEKLKQRNIKMAIATGKDTKRANTVLTHLGIRSYFRVVIGSDQVGRPKPSGEILFKILQETACCPADAVFLGDSIADMRCGHDAGVWTAACSWGQTPIETLKGETPDYVLYQLDDVFRILDWPEFPIVKRMK